MAQETTFDAGFAPAHANMRSSDDFDRAHRHSKRVAVLKKALPATAATIIVVFFALAVTAHIPIANISVDEIGLKEGKLVMEKPKMAGFDKKSRPYDVRALQAIQDLAKPGKVLLNTIDAKLPMNANSFADIDAKSGIYDTESEKLFLNEDVNIRGARGMDISLQDANIDIKTGIMESDNPVNVQSKNTNISADSVRVEDGGERILFNNRVKMTIVRPVERGASEQGN
ncbi:MAG: LPS export ABC transporter periplasmic protein LptC [Rhizobiaceae bacterium]|nr:LPS export ABC transporter periplasmic protein LptC [Hyphomicrobiales bacterium]NRB31367.1 LPS export ABC transporter periplasmic protein LptC [Rhizobiaceae bacterium]